MHLLPSAPQSARCIHRNSLQGRLLDVLRKPNFNPAVIWNQPPATRCTHRKQSATCPSRNNTLIRRDCRPKLQRQNTAHSPVFKADWSSLRRSKAAAYPRDRDVFP